MKESTRSRRSDFGSFIVDRLGTILGLDRGVEVLTGWPAVEVVGRNKDLPRPAESSGDVRATRDDLPLYDGEIPAVPKSRAINLTLNCQDGRRMEVEAMTSPLPGPGDRILVRILRVVALSADDEVPAGRSRRDDLTGLLNRDAFRAQLALDLREATAAAKPLALILADVDHLRHVNDRRLFPRDSDGAESRITLTLGAASFPTDAESGSDLMDRATEALNEARMMGRNRVWCYLRRPRIPVHVPVFFDGSEPLLVGYSRDLSPSGIFVQTSVPLDIGMRCAFNFSLPGHDDRVRVIGRIVRSIPPDMTSESNADVRIPGFGVEFERFGCAGDRTAIDAFLHGSESMTLRPENGILSVRPST